MWCGLFHVWIRKGHGKCTMKRHLLGDRYTEASRPRMKHAGCFGQYSYIYVWLRYGRWGPSTIVAYMYMYVSFQRIKVFKSSL